jgi:hypothetical protein
MSDTCPRTRFTPLALPFWLALLLSPLAACTPLPDIPPIAGNAAPAPRLLPMDDLLAGVAQPRATADSANALAARAARLRARAGLMRGPVLAPDTRQRLAAAIARGEA